MSNVWHCGQESASVAAGVEMDTASGAGLTSVATPAWGDNQWGQRAVRVNHGANAISYLQHQFGATGNTGTRWYYGCAVRWETLPGAECIFIQIFQAVVAYLSVRLTTGGVVRLYRDDLGTQLGVDGPVLVTGRYYWIGVSYDPSTGTASLFIGNRLVATGTAPTTQSSVRFRVGIITSTTGQLYFDDIVINNSSGSRNNSLPLPTFLFALRPNGNGDNNNSSGSYLDINETTPDDATTIAVLDVNGDIIDVNVDPAIAAGRPPNTRIAFLSVNIRERAQSASAESYVLRIMHDTLGALAESGTYTHNDTTFLTNGDTPPRLPFVSETNPLTGVPWRVGELAPIQAGCRAVDAAPDIEITQLWVYVAAQPYPSHLALQGVG